ncbi:MAG: alpha-2-macroglobulin family protein [Gemmataceae bacterium]
MTSPSQEAQAASPARVSAGFQTTEQLRFTVEVPASKKQRNIRVELANESGKVLQSTEKSLEAGAATQTSVRFSGVKGSPANLIVRCKWDDQISETPLDRILLARAHETALIASTEYHAGSETELRVQVRGVRSVTKTVPLRSEVQVILQPAMGKAQLLYRGTTGEDGVAQVRCQVPETPPGDYQLQVTTRSALGEEKLSRPVKVLASPKVLLTSDKPLYQPGQTMRIRALALSSFHLRPTAKAELTFEIEDGKGNKVFKKPVTTDDHGIAFVDFTLADEVNMGEYRVRALLGEHRAEKVVAVRKYVLPKFKVDLKPNKSYFQPKETIRGSIQADYFFGKPVAEGQVEIRASTFDVAFKEFTTFKGSTDRHGHIDFEIKLPDYFVGTPLAGGKAIVKLEARITDAASHTETLTKTYPVSDRPIQLTFLPEGGRIIPSVENRIHVAALYPDGSPATCGVEVYFGAAPAGKPMATLRTGANGLAEFRFTPKADQITANEWGQRNVEMLGGMQQQWGPTNYLQVAATARDDRGLTSSVSTRLSCDALGDNLLLRLDRAIYQGGDRLRVDVLSSGGTPTVYLDVVKSGQTMLTRWLDVKDGKASTSLDLPAHLFGTLDIHAYQVLASGEVVRDSRIVYVNAAAELNIKIQADRKEYRPGEGGKIQFEVTDARGKPAPAALGVLIVDEAVYALQDMQPGLEKVFFTLQEELLKPAAQVNYKPGEAIDTLVRQHELPEAKQEAAKVLFSAVQPRVPSRWQVDPTQGRLSMLRERLTWIGVSLFNYADTNKQVLIRDRKTGQLTFIPGLLEDMVKARSLEPNVIKDSLGQPIELNSLSDFEAKFTPDSFARAYTQHRIQTMAQAIFQLAHNNQPRWFRGGQWMLEESLLQDAVKSRGAHWGLDAWGHAIKLVKRSAKEKNQTGMDTFNQYTLLSPGPDGKLGTSDDVTLHPLNVVFSNTIWWREQSRDLSRANLHMRYRDDQMMFFGGRGAMPGMAGPGGGGMFPPGAGALGGAGGGPMPMMAANTKSMSNPTAVSGPVDTSKTSAEPPAMRLREYFPETLLWQPALITDAQGRATLEVPFADSITTWRLSASASSRAGLLGGVTTPLRVFQDFFVDLDLPVALTQNDEVAFPVAVYNYLKTPQTVTLRLQREPWFELVDEAGPVRFLNLEAGQVTSVRFRIKARKVGKFPLTVEAKGAKLSDAIKRTIEVLPDGTPVEQVFTDRLKGSVKHSVTVPAEAIEDSQRLLVKVYPGVMSQVIEGLEGMLRMPTGCFEQTSSSAYPNILVVDYIKRSRQGSPALLARSEQFLSAGYQRLLTFERPGGGFDWWGSGPPLVWLSAYGLQEFNDMARVWPIDRGIIDRTQAWLMKQQAADGTWSNIGATHGESIERMGDPKLLLTSYVTWALLDSMAKPEGWQKQPQFASLKKAIDYIREHAPRADNPYILALAGNALAAWDAKDDSTHEVLTRLLRKLDGMQERKPEWNAVFFPAKGQSLTYAREDGLSIETTALAVMAMVRHGGFTNSVNKSLSYLIKTKGADGHWGSTQGTILALKALLAGIEGTPQKGETPFTLLVNGKQVATGAITEKNSDVLQMFDLTRHLGRGTTEVAIEVKGETSLMYQVVGRHFAPHRKEGKPARPVLEVDVAYDRTKLSTADLLKATATLRYHGTQPTYNVIVDLPIPPGFTVDAGDFAELVAAKKVQKFSVTARQVILYLGDVKPGSEHTFVYSLKPKYPLRARTPAAVAYEYYTPTNRAESRPTLVVVEEKK